MRVHLAAKKEVDARAGGYAECRTQDEEPQAQLGAHGASDASAAKARCRQRWICGAAASGDAGDACGPAPPAAKPVHQGGARRRKTPAATHRRPAEALAAWAAAGPRQPVVAASAVGWYQTRHRADAGGRARDVRGAPLSMARARAHKQTPARTCANAGAGEAPARTLRARPSMQPFARRRGQGRTDTQPVLIRNAQTHQCKHVTCTNSHPVGTAPFAPALPAQNSRRVSGSDGRTVAGESAPHTDLEALSEHAALGASSQATAAAPRGPMALCARESSRKPAQPTSPSTSASTSAQPCEMRLR